jgi:hypothetical protein
MPVTKVKSKWASGDLIFYKTWATAGETGRPVMVDLTINAGLGGWSNAFKGLVTYGASGYTTGLGSAINAEIALSAGTTKGTYAPLESEIVAAAGAKTGTATGHIYCNCSDASGKANDNAYLFIIGAGYTSNSAHMWYDHQGSAPANVEEWVRVLTPSGARYLALYNAVV